jgi:S1-C subfamily serine protease
MEVAKQMSASLAALTEFSDALAQTTERAAASAVAVHTESRGSASGVIWRNGIVVTAEHALRRDEDIEATLPNGQVVAATLVGRDPSTDLAVLKCPEATSAAGLSSGSADALKPGHITLVVGRTRASGPVAALGIVSLVATERSSWAGTALRPYIRLDVGLQSAAVGGAVANAQGEIVGVATPRFARFGAIIIPASHVNRVTDLLLQKGRIPRGYLGVGLQTVRIPEALRESLHRAEKTGAIVLEVEPESPAHKAGLVIGDVLVSLGGRAVARFEDVHSQLIGENIGKSLAAKIVRGGAVQEVNIVVAERSHGAH